MEIHVLDNAINSLEVGLDFYNKFLDNLDSVDISLSHYGNLKFSVIAIQNSIELFSKAILLDINEFLIFQEEVEKDIILCRLLREQYNNKKSKAHIAYHAVFSVNSYKTINYEKCILLLNKIFYDKLSKNDYEALKTLSEYRNTLTHLGYASNYEWYKILIVLNKSLELLLEFYKDNLIKSQEYFTHEVIDSTLITLNKSKENLDDIWMASRECVLQEINNKFEQYFDNTSVKINNIEEFSEYGFYKNIDFTYNNKGEILEIYWNIIYSYLNESIIIKDNSDLIVGYVSLDDEFLKYSHDENGLVEELEKVYVLVPKEKLYFEQEKIYEIKDKGKNEKFGIRSDKFSNLMDRYLAKLEG